jgi:hypothetical protein
MPLRLARKSEGLFDGAFTFNGIPPTTHATGTTTIATGRTAATAIRAAQ